MLDDFNLINTEVALQSPNLSFQLHEVKQLHLQRLADLLSAEQVKTSLQHNHWPAR